MVKVQGPKDPLVGFGDERNSEKLRRSRRGQARNSTRGFNWYSPLAQALERTLAEVSEVSGPLPLSEGWTRCTASVDFELKRSSAFIDHHIIRPHTCVEGLIDG